MRSKLPDTQQERQGCATPEARLAEMLRSLDELTDPATGQQLPRIGRERAILELIAIRKGYAAGADLPGLDELLLALVDVQRGRAKHPMLTPDARPPDPKFDGERKRPGAPSRGMRELFDMAAAVAVRDILLSRGTKTKRAAAQAASAELASRGVSIPWKRIEYAAGAEILPGSNKLTASWVDQPAPLWAPSIVKQPVAPQAPLSVQEVLQSRYNRLRQRAEQLCATYEAQQIAPREAAYRAIGVVLDLTNPPPSGALSPEAEEILCSGEEAEEQSREIIEAAMCVLKSQ